jgi:hypothetical protein
MGAATANQKVRRPETTPVIARGEPTRPQLASTAATFTLLSNSDRIFAVYEGRSIPGMHILTDRLAAYCF